MSKETLAAGFKTSQQLIGVNIDGISHEDSLKQPELAGNCLNWIAGHILDSRSTALALLGEQPFLSEEEARPYKRGSAPVKPGAPCTDFERLREGLGKTGEIIVSKLNSMDQEDMEEFLDPSLIPVKLEKPTRSAFLNLLLFHEGYHTGQLGISRRLLGLESAVK